MKGSSIGDYMFRQLLATLCFIGCSGVLLGIGLGLLLSWWFN